MKPNAAGSSFVHVDGSVVAGGFSSYAMTMRGTTSDITISATGSVASLNTFGITQYVSVRANLQNAGTIQARVDAVYMYTSDTASNPALNNSGSISSSQGIGVYMHPVNGNGRIGNSGTVTSAGVGIYANGDSASCILHNSSTISGTSAYFSSIGENTDTVYSSGKMIGNVILGSSDDL